MARYSRVLRSMWGDAKFQALSAPEPNGQTLWQRLLTGPEVGIIPGAFSAWEGGLANALKWPLEGFRKAFGEVCGQGMAEADWKAGFVLVPKGIKHNPPQSPNVILSWQDAWDELPDCALKADAYQMLDTWSKGRGKPWSEAFRKACRKPSAKPSPNQEQEQEQDHTPPTEAATVVATPSQLTLEHPDPPETKKKRGSTLAGETPEQIGWRCWRELYAKQYDGSQYAGRGGDGKSMREITEAAKAHAVGQPNLEKGNHEQKRKLIEQICRHWMWAYLEDVGSKGFLLGQRHPLRFLDRDLPRYGLPWDDRGDDRPRGDRPDLRRLGS